MYIIDDILTPFVQKRCKSGCKLGEEKNPLTSNANIYQITLHIT